MVDLFHTAWVKAFIRVNNAKDLATVEILLSVGQQLMEAVPRRAQHPTLDIVLAAMLRPALIVAKAADVNLRHRLYEPALAQIRTLLELDLSLEYMLADAATKDALADRYLAWSRRKRMGPLGEELTNPGIRATLGAERIAWIDDRLRVYQADLDALPAAAAQNQREHNWHPHHDVKGLAQHLGRLDDYLQLYARMSNMNVHAPDPETHLDFGADGSVAIKPLATTEPGRIATILNLMAGMLHGFLSRLRDEWALQGTPFARLLGAAQMRFVGPGTATSRGSCGPRAGPLPFASPKAPCRRSWRKLHSSWSSS